MLDVFYRLRSSQDTELLEWMFNPGTVGGKTELVFVEESEVQQWIIRLRGSEDKVNLHLEQWIASPLVNRLQLAEYLELVLASKPAEETQ